MSTKILCVDDEPHVLEAFRRQLRSKFDLTVNTDPTEALSEIQAGAHYAVIVSDMRMPHVDGISFLRKVREYSPDTIPIMLTGDNDRGVAIKAINEGNIYRFLLKPCSAQALEQVITEALAQYALEAHERDLLQNTLSGCIKVLSDILSMVDPLAFNDGIQVRDMVRAIAPALGIRSTWDMELAAMLGNIGRVVIPPDVLSKQRNHEPLSAQEESLLNEAPATAKNLLISIPRLERIADIVFLQNKNFDGSGVPGDSRTGDQIPLGARVLRIARELVRWEGCEVALTEALKLMTNANKVFDPALLAKLKNEFAPLKKSRTAESVRYDISTSDLCVGQTLLEDVKTSDGRLLITSGTRVTEVLLQKIQNYAEAVGVVQPLFVDARIPGIAANT